MRNNLIILGSVVVFLCVSCATTPVGPPPAQSPCVKYFARLQTSLDQTRSQLPAITRSAESAAKRIVDGGSIYAGGSQPDFAPELLGRAGGLTGIHPVPASMKVQSGDVVLWGVRSIVNDDDRGRILQLRESGAMVVLFASAAQSPGSTSIADAFIDSGPERGLALDQFKICPTDSVINIINAWTWTGEFIGACTRLGKMPVVLESYGLPGGRERGEKYKDQMFHSDMTIRPIDAGMLGSSYVNQLALYLSAIRGDSSADLAGVAMHLRQATAAHSALQAMAHMFPAHYEDVRAPQPFAIIKPWMMNQPPPDTSNAEVTVILGYQQAPQLAVDAAHLRRDTLLYTSVERARDDRAPYITYVNPRWPKTDACVAISGYDIPALPASGVVQAAIYWSLVAEAYVPLEPAR